MFSLFRRQGATQAVPSSAIGFAMDRSRALIVAVAVYSAVGSTSVAQAPLLTRDGSAVNDRFGAVVRGAGDVNLDGRGDFFVGAPGQARAYLYQSFGPGIAYIPFSFAGPAGYGGAIATRADFDGDTVPDYVIGAPGNRVDVFFSGGLGPIGLVYSVPAPAGASARWGSAIAIINDLNGDGSDEFVIGDPGVSPGVATIHSGITGGVLFTLTNNIPFDAFGTAIALISDINGDGARDIAIGAPGDPTIVPNLARVVVFSGAPTAGTPVILVSHIGGTTDDYLGTAVADLGVVAGQSVGSWVAGIPGANGNAGRVEYFNGTSRGSANLPGPIEGCPASSFGSAAERFGTALAAANLDGAGEPEIVVGSPQAMVLSSSGYVPTGAVSVLSLDSGGLTDRVVAELSGRFSGDEFGASVDTEDLDGDGVPELLVGAPGTSFAVGPQAGRVWAYDLTAPLFSIPSRTISISASAPSVAMDFDVGVRSYDRTWIILGSLSGTNPGQTMSGSPVVLPLNRDFYYDLCAGLVNPYFMSGGNPTNYGAIAATTPGTGSVAFNLPPDPSLIGFRLHHAILVAAGSLVDAASNAVVTCVIP